MQRWSALAVAVLFLPLASCTEAPATAPDAGTAPAARAVEAAAPAPRQTFGQGVSAGDRTPIPDLVAEPETFVDRVVRVEGIVSKVCEHRGCWVEIAQEGSAMRVKVDDGAIVFPREIMGSRVAAEGVFTKKVVKHHPEPAPHAGHEDCTEHAHPGTVEQAIYQIQGTGAVVL